jgi:hypothetical protein
MVLNSLSSALSLCSARITGMHQCAQLSPDFESCFILVFHLLNEKIENQKNLNLKNAQEKRSSREDKRMRNCLLSICTYKK